MADTSGLRPRLLFVGAFPGPDSRIAGGNVAACRGLLAAGLGEDWVLDLVDSTSRSVPPPPRLVRLLLSLRRTARVVVRLMIRRPDAFLAFSSGGASFLEKALCANVAELLGIPAGLWIRDGHFLNAVREQPRWRCLARILLRRVSLLPAQGSAWVDAYAGTLGLASTALRFPVIPNWLPEEAFVVERPRGRVGLPRLVFCGWVEESKGVFDLIEAYARVCSSIPEAIGDLTIVGDGSATEELRRRISARGLTGRVRLAGWLHGSAKWAALEAGDIFVLPSHAEGQPNAVLEAMAVGLAVISTDVGAVSDILHDGEEGLLVPAKDIDALARAIASLVTDRVRAEALGERAAAQARENFRAARARASLTTSLRAVIAPAEQD